MPVGKQPRFSFSSLISWIVLTTAFVLVVTLMTLIVFESRSTALHSAGKLFQEISDKTMSRIEVVLRSIVTLSDTVAIGFADNEYLASLEDFSSDVPAFQAMLRDNGLLMSVYMGYEDGGFHQLIATRGDPRILERYMAPRGTEFIDRTILPAKGGGREETWRFFGAGDAVLEVRRDGQVGYDPRVRPWYVKAIKADHSVFTAPYVFHSSRLPGLTCARVLKDKQGVFGVDFTLDQLGRALADQEVTEHGVIWIQDREHRLVAYPGLEWENVLDDDLQLPRGDTADNSLVRAVTSRLESGAESFEAPFFLDADGTMHLVQVDPMPGDLGMHVVIAAPLDDITGYINRMMYRAVLIAAGLLLLIVPVGILIARRASHSLELLVLKSEKIKNFDFSDSPPINTSIKEVQKLAIACDVMKSTIQARTEHLTDTRAKLESLVQEGLALAAEKDLKKLVSLTFHTAQELSNADGGVLYLLENDQLEVELLSLGAESVVLGGLSENPAPRVMVQPRIMSFLSKDSVLRPACEAFNSGEMVIVQNGAFTLFPTGLPEEPKDFPIDSLICAPILTRHGEALGVIQLFNPVFEDKAEIGVDETRLVMDFVGSLAAQVAVTLDNRNLIRSLRDLFDAMIQMVATSIDAKSPYTGGHCTRVPILTEMLARAVHETDEGPLGGFRIETDEEWRQLWIAAWLHDCGKVTTPEYVVDKATKLETIYNRIHEVRMRFEVLRRDAEIEHLHRLLRGGENAEALRKELEDAYRELEEDFAFVAKCNVGGEFMTGEAKERIRAIAGRTWMRHFSDRLGISDMEARAKSAEQEPELPVPEPLLADKAEHVSPRRKHYDELKDVMGNPVMVPENDFNRGEIYNLCIERGTLTPEERFKINEHAISGMEMLAKIPFPENLSKVTEIATAHHETLIGTGYPLKKRKHQLSIESRILAIADIFEALTASDRPYKKAKKLSEALRIMNFMRKDQHIDGDLFDIFLKKGVFREYAKMYLKPEQNDVQDVEKFLDAG